MNHRGLNLDCARHFFAADEVKKIVGEMAQARLNTLHWHLSDDQGWRIESKRFPKLQATGPYYTQDEIKSVVDYAGERGIEVVPEIDMPGHTRSILAAYPELSCTGEQVALATAGGIYDVILCPGKEAVFNFLDELLDELCTLFPGPRFHTGGDEAPKTAWTQCPDCKRTMEKEGLKSAAELQGWFTNRVNTLLKKHGKKCVCWNESLEADNLDSDIQIQFWTVNYFDSFRRFAERGGEFILSDMFHLYLDYPEAMLPLKRVFAWTEKPVLKTIDFSQYKGFQGVEACMWTEHVTTNQQLEAMLFPRLYAVGEGMRPEALPAFLEGAVKRCIAFTPLEDCNPGFLARAKVVKSFMGSMMADVPEDVRKKTVKASAPGKDFAASFMRYFIQGKEDR
jgi:hexosaminidase